MNPKLWRKIQLNEKWRQSGENFLFGVVCLVGIISGGFIWLAILKPIFRLIINLFKI